MENIRGIIEAQCKSTVGYNEAENKESFMIGVSVAISRSEEYYEKKLKEIKSQYDYYKAAYESVSTDMKTLNSIINKYGND